MNFFPHIPMLSTVFNSIGCYLLPFGVVLLWLLYESKKVKTILLAALVLLSMVCMFFHEAFAPSREYPWDCMVEHIFTGTLLPFLCLLGYLLYVFLCACIPVYRKVWKGIGFSFLEEWAWLLSTWMCSSRWRCWRVIYSVSPFSGNSGITFPWSGNVTGFLP